MNEKRKIQAAMRLLGEEKLSEVLGWFGYFGEPSEALVWKAVSQKGEPFITALSKEAQKCTTNFSGGKVITAKVSRLDGDNGTKVETPATTTTTNNGTGSNTSSNVQGWITSAFGWLKSGSDIGLDWAKLMKDNPGAYQDANGNLYAANGTLLAMAGSNTANSASNNTLLYIAIGVVVLVVVGAIFLRK